MADESFPGWTDPEYAQATQLYEDLREVAMRAIETDRLSFGVLMGAATAFMGETLGRCGAYSTATHAEFAQELEDIFFHVTTIAMDIYALAHAQKSP
jgi:hypothetical protein